MSIALERRAFGPMVNWLAFKPEAGFNINALSAEMRHLDPEVFDHSRNVATILRLSHITLGKTYILSPELRNALKATENAAKTHDIGKFGIRPTIQESLRALYPETVRLTTDTPISPNAQFDLRTADERAAIHLHTIVGRDILQELANSGFIPTSELPFHQFIAASHHEGISDHKKPYVRTEKVVTTNPVDGFAHLVFKLADVTEAMSGTRSYRPHPLPTEVIRRELELFAHPELVLIAFQALTTQDSPEQFRNTLITTLIRSAAFLPLRPQINRNQLNLRDAETLTGNAVEITRAVSAVWQKHQERYDRIYTFLLAHDQEFHHATRTTI